MRRAYPTNNPHLQNAANTLHLQASFVHRKAMLHRCEFARTTFVDAFELGAEAVDRILLVCSPFTVETVDTINDNHEQHWQLVFNIGKARR